MVITNGLTKKGVERLGPRSGKLIAFAVPSVYVKVCELQKVLFSFPLSANAGRVQYRQQMPGSLLLEVHTAAHAILS